MRKWHDGLNLMSSFGGKIGVRLCGVRSLGVISPASFVGLAAVYSMLLGFSPAALMADEVCQPEIPGGVAGSSLLWRVSKRGERPDYVFGTMHHGGEWVEEVISQLEPYMVETNGLVVEIEVGHFSAMDMMDRALLPTGQALYDFFTPEVYDNIKQAMLLTLPARRLEHMKPWYVFVNMRTNARENVQIMDSMLEERYRQRSLPVSGLESVLDQITAYDALSLEQQAWMVERALAAPDESPFSDLDQKLKKLYQAGKLAELWTVQHDYSQHMGASFSTFNDTMLSSRSDRMVKKLLPRLDHDELFIAVGALHLLGESGLICQLEHAGYQVSPVSFQLALPATDKANEPFQ